MNKMMSNSSETGIIWQDPNKAGMESEGMNRLNDEPHNKMATHIADTISYEISDDYESRLIMKKMIRNKIRETMGVFLREYDNIVAEDILRSFKSELRNDWDDNDGKEKKNVQFSTETPDYSHARHAKLSSFARELREKIVMIKKSK